MTKSDRSWESSSLSTPLVPQRLLYVSRTGLKVYREVTPTDSDSSQVQDSVPSQPPDQDGWRRDEHPSLAYRMQLKGFRFVRPRAGPIIKSTTSVAQDRGLQPGPDARDNSRDGQSSGRKPLKYWKFLRPTRTRKSLDGVQLYGSVKKQRVSADQRAARTGSGIVTQAGTINPFASTDTVPSHLPPHTVMRRSSCSMHDHHSPSTARTVQVEEEASGPPADVKLEAEEGSKSFQISIKAGETDSKTWSTVQIAIEDDSKTKRRLSDEVIDFGSSDNESSNSSTPSCARQPKRARGDTFHPPKSDQFWLIDGSIVIEAGGTQFKLHRSRLVEQSALFALALGELGVAPLEETEDLQRAVREELEFIEDGPSRKVCRLKNVSSRDWLALLELDRDPLQFHFSVPTLPTLSSLLRASTSLYFGRCRALAIKFLEAEWSSSLADLTPETKAGAMEVAVLGRKCGVKGVLKRAFYEIARAKDGYGAVAPSEGHKDSGNETVGALQDMSRADLALIDKTKARLASVWAKMATRAPVPQATHGGIKCSTTASAQRDSWDRLVHDSGIYNTFLFDPLCGLQLLASIQWEGEGWCEKCVQMWREAWLHQREELWEWMGVELSC